MSRLQFISRWVWLALVLAAFAARVAGLGAQSLWYDEGYTIMLARQPVLALPRLAMERELNMPLHYLLLKGWVVFAGDGEFAGRALSVVLGVVAVACAIRLSREMRGRYGAAAALGAALVAFSPVCIGLSRELRMYSLAVCLSMASSLALWLALRRGHARAWAAWVVLCAGAFGAHVITAFVFGGHVAALMALAARRELRQPKFALAGAGGVLLFMAASVSVILSFASGYGTNFGERLAFFAIFAKSINAIFWLGDLPSGAGILALFLLALIVCGAALALRRKGNNPAAFWGIVSVAALAGIAAFCAFTGKFAPRYAAIVAPQFLLAGCFAVFALAAHFGVSARAALGGLAVGVMALWLGAPPISPNEDFRGASAFLRQHVRQDEMILLVSGHFAPVFEYYHGALGWAALPPDAVLDVRNALDYATAVPMLNNALQNKNGAWLLLWQDSAIDPAKVTQTLLARQAVRFSPDQELEQFAGLRLVHYTFNAVYQPLPDRWPIPPGAAAQGPTGLRGEGCFQARVAWVGDVDVEVLCQWRVIPFGALPWDTQISARLGAPSGQQIAQVDENMAQYGLPVQRFDKPILAVYRLPLPNGATPGDYSLEVVPYLRAGGEVSPRQRAEIRIQEK